MFEQAEKITKDNNKTKIISYKGSELESLNLNLLYNVGKGSKNPPMLVNLFYEGNSTNPNDIYCLIGKVYRNLIYQRHKK